MANIFDNAIVSTALEPGEELEELYMGIYRGGITLINGETGKGKSSVRYALELAASSGGVLWGIPWKKPEKILALDPENDDAIRYARIERIGYPKNENLYYHNGEGINLKIPAQVDKLIEYLLAGGFTGLTIDPICRLFQTNNENDNAEANIEMGQLLRIVRATGVWALAIHHTGKGAGDAYGRGASARLGACHVGMTYRVRSDDPDEVNDDYGVEVRRNPFIARLQVCKNRFKGGTTSLFLQSNYQGVDDRFGRVEYDDWVNKAVKGEPGNDVSAPEKARGVILQILNGEMNWVPGTELKATSKVSGVSESAFKTALPTLIAEGIVVSKDLGKNNAKGYALKAMADAQKDWGL